MMTSPPNLDTKINPKTRARFHKGEVWLTERDKLLFQYLFEKKGAARNQIARDIFVSCNINAASRRLTKLRKARYITSRAVNTFRHCTYIYELSGKGLQVIASDYPFQIDSPTLKSDSIIHDLNLVDIDARLHKLKSVANFYTENTLASCSEFQDIEGFAEFSYLRSDRVLLIRSKERTFRYALEFEQSSKAKIRYVEKFRSYYQHESIKGVLYICADDRLSNGLMAIDERVAADLEAKIYFCDLKTFLEEEEEIRLRNTKGKIFTLS